LTDLEVKPKSTILTNAYTQDFVRYNVGVNGLLDGRAPYLEAALLKRANKILDLTGSYMADPFTHPFPFAKYHVRYVLAGTAPFALGTPAVFPTDIGKLRLDPTLAVVQEGPGYTLFKVRDPGV
jgi:hypothetical protein